MTNRTSDLQYSEFVTGDVDATCATYEAALGVSFSAPGPEAGHARTAEQAHGGWIGVRGPRRADENSTTPIPARGIFDTFIQGGVQHALWQN